MARARRRAVVAALLPWFSHAWRYVVAGGLAVLTLYAVLAFLIEVVGTNETFASAVGYGFGVPVNYLLQHRFVFASRRQHVDTLPWYASITAVTLGLNTVLFWLLVERFSVPYGWAQALTLGVITPINFILNRMVTFSAVRWGSSR